MTAGDPEIIGSTALYIGDCLGILPLLRGVDHVIADPPYEDELHGAVGGIERIDGRAPPQGPDFPGIGGTRAEAAMKIASCACGWAAVFTLAEGVGAWLRRPSLGAPTWAGASSGGRLGRPAATHGSSLR